MLLMSFDASHWMNLHKTLNRFFEYAFILLNKKNINFCYIGTARNDARLDYFFFKLFIRIKFGKNFKVSSLNLTNTVLSKQEIEQHLRLQDILFIGGGNTEKMLQVWESTGFSEILNRFKKENSLPMLAGVSAGAMYPFYSGLTYSSPTQYKPLTCIQWYQDSFCPHANNKLARFAAFKSAIHLGLLPPGYAVANDCMLHFFNFNLVRTLSSRPNNPCYYVNSNNVEKMAMTNLTSSNISDVINKGIAGSDASTILQKECGWYIFSVLTLLEYVGILRLFERYFFSIWR